MPYTERHRADGLPSRRDFLKTAGAGLTFALVFGPSGVQSRPAPRRATAFGAWVRIDPDGGVLIFNPSAEMGQGSMTALPVIVAEEMDADWARVRIEHAPVDPERYGSVSWGRKRMNTSGSRTVTSYFTDLRRAGAQIRRVLLDNAARHWQVNADELTTEPGVVVHAPTGQRLTYGEIAAFAVVPNSLPEIDDADLKSPADFRLIGHSLPRRDVPAKTDGSARYAIDVHLPDMLHGMVEHAPVPAARPISYDQAAVEALPGVVATVRLEHGVGIVGTSFEAVAEARSALGVVWSDDAPARRFDSAAALDNAARQADEGALAVESVSGQGDAPAALERAVRRYTAEYRTDHVYHAQMEPLNAVASVSETGDAVEVWAGTQNPEGAVSQAARALGIPADRVTLHRCFLGGGFGRRSHPDFVVEAVQLSEAVRRPVKMIWTREDDLGYGMFRPMSLQRLWAGLDADGRLVAWRHCLVGDGGGMLTSGSNLPFYDVPNQAVERCALDTGVRLHYWRAVGHGANKFAIEAFLDEIAADRGVDPYAFRCRLLSDAPRALAVFDAAAELADWGGPVPEGRGRSIVFIERYGAIAAGVAEVSVEAETGKIRVHRFWSAVDAGIIVQPDNARAQVEGAIAHGLSSALHERVTFKDGRVEQSNYHDYPLLRMSEMPEIEVRFMASEEHPVGLGEVGLPLAGGAVANAFAALTGKRLYHMPFTPERVRAALG